MKAKELRIGNWVTQYNEFIKGLTSNSIHKFQINQIHLDPILVTDEWLQKLGFRYSEALTLWMLWEGNTIFEQNDDIENSCLHGIHFYHNGNHLIVESTNDHGEYGNMMFSHIKYVHQIQNTYFALTSEELIVKS